MRAGLDIGGTKIHGILLSDDGEVLASLQTATDRGPDGVVAGAADVVTRLAARAGLPVGDLVGVGIGIPGVVDHRSGTVRHAVNVGIDDPLPLTDRLRASLGVRVVVNNDVDAAALGGAHLLGGDDPDLALLSLGTGVAAGLVLDGVVRRGGGAAGEIGHIPIDPSGPDCPCGQRGCLELYASGTALDRMWPTTTDHASSAALADPSPATTEAQPGAADRARTGDVGPPAPVALFAAAAAGDATALRARDAYADAVATAVRLLVLGVDPRRVLLGGGVSRLGEPLLDAVRAALARQASGSRFLSTLNLAGRVDLVPADLPVAATGAALLLSSPAGGGRGGIHRAVGPATATW